jgi:hypothetical protein
MGKFYIMNVTVNIEFSELVQTHGTVHQKEWKHPDLQSSHFWLIHLYLLVFPDCLLKCLLLEFSLLSIIYWHPNMKNIALSSIFFHSLLCIHLHMSHSLIFQQLKLRDIQINACQLRENQGLNSLQI